MYMLEEGMEQAMKDKDEETRREPEIEARRMQKEIGRLKDDAERLVPEHMVGIDSKPAQPEFLAQ